MKRIQILVFFLLVSVWAALAQNGEFKASAPAVVAIGEQFRLTYSLSGSGEGFQGPDLRDFTILGGPSQSSQSSIQIINGQVAQSVSLSYTYFLTPTKEGKFNIGPASVKLNGKLLKSNSVSIEVVKNQSSGGQQQQRQGNGQRQQSGTQGVNSADFFVGVDLSKTSVYQGEHLVATIKVYTRLDLVGFENMKFPTYDGFWSQDIETPQNIQLERQNVDGQIYNVGVIKKVILFPQRSGELTIDAFEVDAVVRQQVKQRQQGFFDNFFGMGYQNVKVKASTKTKKVTVKALPGNKPASFGGAVGNLSMTASVNKKQAKTNDAISLKIKISGNGNLKLIEAPEIQFPADFEVYDPKVENNFKTSARGMEGVKSFEWLMIPRHAGEFSIPAVEFSYFDIASGSYKTSRSEEFNFQIEKGSDTASVAVVSGLSKEDVKFIGKDIRFIKTGNPGFKPLGVLFFGSISFWLALLIPIIVFIVIFFVFRRKIRENQNIGLMKNRRANKVATRRMKLAGQYLKANNENGFFEEVLKAFWGYFSDKLGIPVADLSRESMMDSIARFNPGEELLTDLKQVLDDCEYARYAPSGTGPDMQTIFTKAVKIISTFEEIIR